MVDRIIWNGSFFKEPFEALLSPLRRKSEKVNLSESGSQDYVDQIVWNFDTFQIHILTQCVPNFVHIGPPDHIKKYVVQRAVSKRYYRHFGESRKKVNLSENVSRDGVDKMVWNFYSFSINVSTQCVPKFVHISPPDHMKRTVFSKSHFKALLSNLIKLCKALAKDGKRSIFRKALLGIECTKLSEI